MSVETNKALLRRFVEEIVNQGNMAVAPELIAEDFVELDPFPGQAPGRAGLIESIERLRTAFPNLIWSLDEMVAEEEKAQVPTPGAAPISASFSESRPRASG
jgi:hypothetical protein